METALDAERAKSRGKDEEIDRLKERITSLENERETQQGCMASMIRQIEDQKIQCDRLRHAVQNERTIAQRMPTFPFGAVRPLKGPPPSSPRDEQRDRPWGRQGVGAVEFGNHRRVRREYFTRRPGGLPGGGGARPAHPGTAHGGFGFGAVDDAGLPTSTFFDARD